MEGVVHRQRTRANARLHSASAAGKARNQPNGRAALVRPDDRRRVETTNPFAFDLCDREGLPDFQERSIAALVESGAPIDVFGVGTELATSRDAPALSGVYKLARIGTGARSRGTAKRSEGKVSDPGPREIHRRTGRDGIHREDRIVLAHEKPGRGARALLVPVMRKGVRTNRAGDHHEARARWEEERGALPPAVRRLEDPEPYRVVRSRTLLEARRRAVAGSGYD